MSIRRLTAASLVCVCTLWACGGESRSPSPIQPSAPAPPPVTLTSIVVGVAGNAPPALAPGEKLQLYAQAVNSDDTRVDVTNTALWQSSNPAIATVSAGGVLTAAAEGALDVTASYQGRAGSLHADVQKPGCRASLSPSSLAYSAFGASAIVSVTTTESTCRWSAKSDSSWLSLTYDPNKSGPGQFSYNVPPNSTTSPRTANIIVSVQGGPSAVHTVTQEKPVGCSYVIEPAKLTLPNTGGSGAFDLVTTPSDCQWNLVNNGASSTVKVTITGPTSGIGNAHITYTVGANPYTFDYSNTIEIRGLSGMNPPGIHTLTVTKK